jgi:hypothetical protein
VSKFQRVQESGVTFVFKVDEDAPALLHIFARHLMEPVDAIAVWFESDHEWNVHHQRFEACFEGVGIYWYWIDEPKQVVMIASCFTL